MVGFMCVVIWLASYYSMVLIIMILIIINSAYRYVSRQFFSIICAVIRFDVVVIDQQSLLRNR
jgi:hypothetical protein